MKFAIFFVFSLISLPAWTAEFATHYCNQYGMQYRVYQDEDQDVTKVVRGKMSADGTDIIGTPTEFDSGGLKYNKEKPGFIDITFLEEDYYMRLEVDPFSRMRGHFPQVYNKRHRIELNTRDFTKSYLRIEFNRERISQITSIKCYSVR